MNIDSFVFEKLDWYINDLLDVIVVPYGNNLACANLCSVFVIPPSSLIYVFLSDIQASFVFPPHLPSVSKFHLLSVFKVLLFLFAQIWNEITSKIDSKNCPLENS